MKKVIGVFISMAVVTSLPAQTKRIQVMLQQISANAAHMQQLRKGIQIAGKGLQFIGNAKQGNWNLHTLFFNSLLQINPVIKKWERVGDIVSLQHRIVLDCHLHTREIHSSGQLTAAETGYVSAVFSRLITYTLANISELTQLLTADVYQMGDEERIRRIESIYNTMLADADFAQSFGSAAILLAKQRQHSFNDNMLYKKLNGSL